MNYNIFKAMHLRAVIIPMLLLVLAAGCKDEKADYIHLSISSFTFDPNGEDVVTIDIEASQSWGVEYEGRWVVEKEKGNQSITLGASPTQSGADRTAKVIFRAGEAVETVYLSQLGTNINFTLLDPSSAATVLSPNGKYIGGVTTKMTNDVYEFIPFTINLATGARVEKPVLSEAHIASGISDDGFLIIQEESKSISKYYVTDSELAELQVPAGMKGPAVSATSADGSILVGFAQKDSDRKYYPIKWVNREPQLLEVPERSLLDKPLDVGVYARGCSADGSIIYGAIADDQTALYWKDGKVDFLGKDKIKVHTITINHTGEDISFQVADRPTFYADNSSISADGRYIATTFLVSTVVNKNEKLTSYPAYYDFEKETLTYITDIPGGFEDGAGATISNEGILSFGCPAVGYTNAFVYDIHTKTTWKSPDYLREEYGVTVSNSSLITKMANGGKTLFGLNILILGSAYQYWYLDVAE